MVDPLPMAPPAHRKASSTKKKAIRTKVAKKATKKAVKKPAKKAVKKNSAQKSFKKAPNKAGGKRTGTWKHTGNVNRTTTRRPVSKPPKLDMDADVMDFIAAIDVYKGEYHRPFPGWSEILFVIKRMGYKKA